MCAVQVLTTPATGSVKLDGCALYYEEVGEGVPILLIPPAGSTASTWGSAADELVSIGRLITYDRRGYARSGGEPPHSMSTHTADAAALLQHLRASPAVVVGTSAGAGIGIDLAVRRPDLVGVVIAHEFPWRAARHLPTGSQLAAVGKIASLVVRGRHDDAAEVLLRAAYAYRDGGTAWDAFPEEWRRVGRKNARVALADFVNSIRNYPSARDLATVRIPVLCSYGARSPDFMPRLVGSLASAIPTARTQKIDGAAHAAPFDATTEFVRLIAEAVASSGAGHTLHVVEPEAGRMEAYREGRFRRGRRQAVTVGRAVRAGRTRVRAIPADATVDGAALRNLLAETAAEARLVEVPGNRRPWTATGMR